MAIQVWRPENERPGRHFVYTTRYVYFFVHLLDQLDDRAGLDQLLRRVRKRQGDFINHPKLWEDICLTYGRVIRRAGKINEGHEEGIFKPIGWDEFVANTGRLENLPELVAPESASLLELLRDSIELKKLNNNLMKVSLLEDLIADLYSRLYELNLPNVIEQASEENKEKMKVDHLMNLDGAVDAHPSASAGPGGSTSNPLGTTSAPGPAQLTTTTPTEAPASVPRGRTKGIARRDIQKRAEAIVASKLTTRPPTKPTTITSATATTETEPQNANETASSSTVPAKVPKSEPGTKDKKPGSTRESEDESELSEIDEEKITKLDVERPNRPQEPGSEMSVPDGDGEGDTMIEESFISAAPGDETEVIDEEEGEGDEGDEEGGDVADGEDGDDEGEGDNENEGEGETDILKDTEEGEAEQEQYQVTGDEPEAMET